MVLGMGWSWRSGRTGRGSYLGENAKQVQLAGCHQGSTSSGSEAILILPIHTTRYAEGLICWLSWYPKGLRTRLYISQPCVCFCFLSAHLVRPLRVRPFLLEARVSVFIPEERGLSRVAGGDVHLWKVLQAF